MASYPTPSLFFICQYLCHWAFYGPNAHHYKGFLDEFRVYTRKLSQQEIATSMSVRANTSDPSLIAYFDFDAIVFDQKTNGSGEHIRHVESSPVCWLSVSLFS